MTMRARLTARIGAIIGAAALTALTMTAPPAQAETWSGGGNAGHVDAPNYYNGKADIFMGWTRASEDGSGTGHLSGYVRITGVLPVVNTHKQCIQVAVDWKRPAGENHYDVRITRNCDDSGTPTTVRIGFNQGSTGDFYEPNPICQNVTQPANCDMPMGRVQIARYVPFTGQVIQSSILCGTFSGIAISDCSTWNPSCPIDKKGASCWIRNADGGTTFHSGGVATDPDRKRKR